MPESRGHSTGPFRQIITLLFIGILALYVTKIYLREPEYRHVEVCYLPYKLGHLVWVDTWGLFINNDTASYLKHSRDLNGFFKSCTNFVGKQSWLLKISSSPQTKQGNGNG